MIRKAIILCFLIFNVAKQANAADVYRIQDFISGKYLELTDNYKELKDSRYNFYDKIGIRYPQLILGYNKAVEDKINKRFTEIFINQINTEVFKVKLFADLDDRFKILYKTRIAKEDRGGEIYDKRWKANPEITAINYHILNYTGNIVTISAEFSYHVKINGMERDEGMEYLQIYYYDISNGKEYSAADVFKKDSWGAVSKLVANKLQGFSFKDPDIEDDDDDDDSVEVKAAGKRIEKILNSFNAEKEGYAYLKTYSIAFVVPAYSSATELLESDEIEIHFSIDEIKHFLNPQGPYANLLKLPKPGQVKWHHFNVPEFYTLGNPITIQLSNSFLRPPHIANLFDGEVSLHAPDAVSTMNFYTMQKNGKDTSQTKKVYRTLTYNEKGLLVKVEEPDYNAKKEYLFSYNEKGNLISLTDRNTKKKTEQIMLLAYDINDNLQSIICHDQDGKMISGFYYTYIDSFVLIDEYSFSKNASFNIKRIDINKDMKPYVWHYLANNSWHNLYYHYDEQGHAIASYSNKGSLKESNYATYINNRIVAEEYDNDRRLTTYTYDVAGNMIAIDKYDYLNWQAGSKFQYNDRKLPMSKKSLVNNNYFDTSDVNRWMIEYVYKR